jgi:hypothetical protein
VEWVWFSVARRVPPPERHSMNGTPTLRNGYDAFISHNRADKPFARALADRLAGTDYAGRPLRPWLDEQVLDPGSLSGEAELTSALDRSRRLVLVLSPASVGSKWVEFELAYFLKARPPGDVVPLLKAPCTLPGLLGDAQPIDFTVEGGGDRAFAELHARLCPPGGSGLADVERDIDAAWANALGVDPGGMDAEPSPERDALLTALLRHPIDDAATEGPALVGFMHAARRCIGIRAIASSRTDSSTCSRPRARTRCSPSWWRERLRSSRRSTRR